MGKGSGLAECKRPPLELGDKEYQRGPALVPSSSSVVANSALQQPSSSLASGIQEAFKDDRYPRRLELEHHLEEMEGKLQSLEEDPTQYMAWLSDLGENKMYRYSLSNYILLMTQAEMLGKPLTRVATYNGWQKQGRQVRAGEKAYDILRPCTRPVTITDDDGNPVLDKKGKPRKRKAPIPGRFTLTASPFDISQTDPIDPDNETSPDQRQGATDCLRDLAAVAAAKDIEVHLGSNHDRSATHQREIDAVLLTQPGVGGFCTELPDDDGKLRTHIVTRQGLSQEEEARVLAHELSHALLGHGDYESHEDRQLKELEAEGSAYALCAAYGVESDYSPNYIFNWNSEDTAKRWRGVTTKVRNTVKTFFETLEADEDE